jgi:hypothetical protein
MRRLRQKRRLEHRPRHRQTARRKHLELRLPLRRGPGRVRQDTHREDGGGDRTAVSQNHQPALRQPYVIWVYRRNDGQTTIARLASQPGQHVGVRVYAIEVYRRGDHQQTAAQVASQPIQRDGIRDAGRRCWYGVWQSSSTVLRRVVIRDLARGHNRAGLAFSGAAQRYHALNGTTFETSAPVTIASRRRAHASRAARFSAR